MQAYKALENEILNIHSEILFNNIALKVFELQKNKVPIYNAYIKSLPEKYQFPDHFTKIPFLPIEFFKTNKVIDPLLYSQITFFSSATTGITPSSHFVADPEWYKKIYSTTFNQFYGNPDQYCILALLPSYLEREGSSLVEMVSGLIDQSNHPDSGFYLNEFEKLFQVLLDLKAKNQKTFLIGVTFGLLDFLEKYKIDFPKLIAIETGGMKGRRKELLREEVHALLKDGFGVDHIHSEYGMTELLSQAYSKNEGIFHTPPQMKILIRDINDPFSLLGDADTGGINIIDLGNLYSCSFIATQDLGKKYSNNSFEVLGRFDNVDIRGCNLMVV